MLLPCSRCRLADGLPNGFNIPPSKVPSLALPWEPCRFSSVLLDSRSIVFSEEDLRRRRGLGRAARGPESNVLSVKFASPAATSADTIEEMDGIDAVNVVVGPVVLLMGGRVVDVRGCSAGIEAYELGGVSSARTK